MVVLLHFEHPITGLHFGGLIDFGSLLIFLFFSFLIRFVVLQLEVRLEISLFRVCFGTDWTLVLG